MDFENNEVVGHEAHYQQRLLLEAWMSVKDPNAGNDHMVILATSFLGQGIKALGTRLSSQKSSSA